MLIIKQSSTVTAASSRALSLVKVCHRNRFLDNARLMPSSCAIYQKRLVAAQSQHVVLPDITAMYWRPEFIPTLQVNLDASGRIIKANKRARSSTAVQFTPVHLPDIAALHQRTEGVETLRVNAALQVAAPSMGSESTTATRVSPVVLPGIIAMHTQPEVIPTLQVHTERPQVVAAGKNTGFKTAARIYPDIPPQADAISKHPELAAACIFPEISPQVGMIYKHPELASAQVYPPIPSQVGMKDKDPKVTAARAQVEVTSTTSALDKDPGRAAARDVPETPIQVVAKFLLGNHTSPWTDKEPVAPVEGASRATSAPNGDTSEENNHLPEPWGDFEPVNSFMGTGNTPSVEKDRAPTTANGNSVDKFSSLDPFNPFL